MASSRLLVKLVEQILGDKVAKKPLPPREGVGSTGSGPRNFEDQLSEEGVFIPEGEPRTFQSQGTPDEFLDTSRKFGNLDEATPKPPKNKITKVPTEKTLDQLDLEGRQSREGVERIDRQLLSEGLANPTRISEQNINNYIQDTFNAWNEVFPEFNKPATRANPGLGAAGKRLKDGFRKLSAAADSARNTSATEQVRRKAIKEVISIREWLTK